MDEPPRLASSPRPPAPRSTAALRGDADRGLRGRRERGLYGVQFHPEVVHTPARHGDPQELPLRDRRCAAVLDARRRDRGAGRSGSASRSAASACSAGSRAASTARSPRCSSTRRSATSSPASSSTTASCAGTRPRRSSRRSASHFGVPLVHVEAQERFLAKLAGVSDPEEKRKRIGEEFIRVFEEEARPARRHPLARPGNALLRRDRVGRRATGSPRRSRATTTSAACRPT